MSYNYLVIGDTNNVLDYIFSSTKYKLIRGASMILDKLNRAETERLVMKYKGEKLSASGGELRVLFCQEGQAKSFLQELREIYLDFTDEVTLSATIVNRKSKDESMASWIQRAEKELRKYEISEGKKQMPFIQLAPIIKRCEICNKRPGECQKYTPEGKQVFCRSCYVKANYVEEIKKKLRNQANLSDSEMGLMEVHEKLLAQTETNDAKKSRWVDKIANLIDSEDAKGNQYIGFIYGDGKKIGTLFRKTLLENKNISTDEEFINQYIDISTKLHESLIEAAVKTELQFSDKECTIDYALIGGDDFAAIVTGKYAISYANTLLKYFNQITKEKMQSYGGQHMALGIVIAKANYPIHRLFSLSNGLMDETKRKNSQSCLDYIVLTDSTVQTIKEIRANDKINGKLLRCEGFAVSPTEQDLTIDKLLDVIQKLKQAGFPRSKIKEVYELVREEDDFMLEYRWLLWRSRLKPSVRNILDDWNSEFKKTPFAFNKNGHPCTPLLDLFDIYDVVEYEQKGREEVG